MRRIIHPEIQLIEIFNGQLENAELMKKEIENYVKKFNEIPKEAIEKCLDTTKKIQSLLELEAKHIRQVCNPESWTELPVLMTKEEKEETNRKIESLEAENIEIRRWYNALYFQNESLATKLREKEEKYLEEIDNQANQIEKLERVKTKNQVLKAKNENLRSQNVILKHENDRFKQKYCS